MNPPTDLKERFEKVYQESLYASSGDIALKGVNILKFISSEISKAKRKERERIKTLIRTEKDMYEPTYEPEDAAYVSALAGILASLEEDKENV